MKLNDIRRNDYVELDFDNRFKVEGVADHNITITGFTSMNTQYGKKNVAMFTFTKGKKTIEGWFYLTETLDHLLEYEVPFDVTITKKKAKTGNREYWTSDLKTEYNNVKVIDFVGKIITIINIEEIDTKYGKAYRVTAEADDEVVSFLTSWEYLYFDLLEAANENDTTIEALLNEDPLVLEVIEKKSKNNRKYISYKDVEDDINDPEVTF